MEFLKNYYGENYPAFSHAFIRKKIANGLYSYMALEDKAIVTLEEIRDLEEYRNFLKDMKLQDDEFTLDIKPAEKN